MTQQSLIEGIHRANQRRRVRARAFREEGGGSYTATVPGGNGYVYIRLTNGALTIAQDGLGLSSPTDDDAPIWVEPQPDGTWRITARRYEG